MFGKIVAISTVKHLSRNYASFQQPSVQEWYSLSLLVRHKIFRKGTPLTFMEMDTSCRTQDTKQKKSPSWCVMLTLEKKGCKSIFCFFCRFLFKSIKNGQNRLYAIDQKQRNNSKDAQIYYPSIQNNVLLPL